MDFSVITNTYSLNTRLYKNLLYRHHYLQVAEPADNHLSSLDATYFASIGQYKF